MTTYLQAQEAQQARVARRPEIAAYIQDLLGPDLCGAKLATGEITYAEAVILSVATGCYDSNFEKGDYGPIVAYVHNLRQDWLGRQGDPTSIVARLRHLQSFGTKAQKDMLAKLELL